MREREFSAYCIILYFISILDSFFFLVTLYCNISHVASLGWIALLHLPYFLYSSGLLLLINWKNMAKLHVAYVCTFFMFTCTEEESGIMLVGWLASERLACTCFEWMSQPNGKSKRRERESGRKCVGDAKQSEMLNL